MSPSLIFITGSTGFIGNHTLSQSLKAGYRVRLSVRKAEQIDSIKSLFSEYIDHLEFVVIPDLTAEGAFNNALEGVDYIFHLASPMPGRGSDIWADYVHPAVKGTTAILDAAKTASSVKRVVIVSSILALIPVGQLAAPNLVVKEGTNKDLFVDLDMPLPEGPPGLLAKYQISKILAHRASLEWVETHSPHFSLITLHPSFVFGHNMMQKSADAISGTNALFWGSLFSEKPLIPLAAVDVRDVAGAHLKALQANIGSGVTEFILNGRGWSWEAVVEFVREKYAALGIKLQGPFQGTPNVHTERAEKVLGLEWTKVEDTVSSVLDQQLHLRAQV